MSNEKEINKIETFLSNVRNDSIYVTGVAKGSQELLDRQKKLLNEMKEEFQKSINEGKLNVEVGNFCITQVNRFIALTQAFITEKSQLQYAKMGAIDALMACMDVLKESEKKDNVITQEENEKKSEVKSKRPDDPDGMMGKRLQDIKTRKRKSQ